jgi:hypothetical protein
MGSQILIISPLLTIYRVAEGKAFSGSRKAGDDSSSANSAVSPMVFSSMPPVAFSPASLKHLSPETSISGLESEKSSV